MEQSESNSRRVLSSEDIQCLHAMGFPDETIATFCSDLAYLADPMVDEIASDPRLQGLDLYGMKKNFSLDR